MLLQYFVYNFLFVLWIWFHLNFSILHTNHDLFFPAEFIIHIAHENDTFTTFKNALLNNGAEFPVSYFIILF